MGRAPCCDKGSVKKGPWSPEEDRKLREYIHSYGTGGNWISLPAKAGLRRCGKSCRLRWLNYLRPNLRHGGFSEEEDRLIYGLFAAIGSRWSVIAAQLPGRTDNDVKNHWNTKLKKKLHLLMFGAYSGLDMFGAEGYTSSSSMCSVDGNGGLHFDISNGGITNSHGPVGLESFIFGGLQQELFPAAAATAENDIGLNVLTSGGLLRPDHHLRQYYGESSSHEHEQRSGGTDTGTGSSSFFYGDGEAATGISHVD